MKSAQVGYYEIGLSKMIFCRGLSSTPAACYPSQHQPCKTGISEPILRTTILFYRGIGYDSLWRFSYLTIQRVKIKPSATKKVLKL